MKNKTSSVQMDSFYFMGNLTFDTQETDPIPTPVLLRFHIGMTSVWYVICLTGVCTNLLNLRTFASMGLNDSVTVSFFCLSISDFNLCSMAFIDMVAFTLDVLQRKYQLFFYLPPIIPAIFFMCVRKIFNTTTILITTFLAVQRCLCVVMPFHVRGMFTRSRTIVFMFIILTFATACSALYMWRHKVTKGVNPALNKSQIQVYVPPGSEPYLYLMEVFIGIGLNVGCQAVVVICLAVMGIFLRRSYKFRQSATAVQVTETATANEKTECPDTTQIKGNGGGCGAVGAQTSKESSKERQALVQVSLVSTIFVVTNWPYLVFGIANSLIPEFGLYQAYHNLFHLVHNLMFTMELLNSSVNLAVYYKYNSKFRKCFPFGRVETTSRQR